ncbi:hypothetical protein ACFVV7_37035 [Streptomyces globisporus]|uniref:hypothetical protein n=1 Tax=Streptomyces globisporus TaxID=1908 RepID=UPI0036DF566E
MTGKIPQGEGNEDVSSYEETVRRLLRTPEAKAEAARRGLDTDAIAEGLVRTQPVPLLIDLDPQSEQLEAAELERLLWAEAERRGVTVDALVDTLVRAARRHPVAPGTDPQPGSTVRNHRRGGIGKSSAVFELHDPASLPAPPAGASGFLDRLRRPGADAGGTVAFGAMGSGKTDSAGLIRADLDARGARYTERTVIRRGVEMVEFDVEDPRTGEELR